MMKQGDERWDERDGVRDEVGYVETESKEITYSGQTS